MQLEGKIKFIGNTETFGNNGFRKRDMVVTTEEQYPQHISVQFVQDKTDLLNNFQVGNDVKININLRGREWVNPQGETKYFNTIQGWQIVQTTSNQNNAQSPPPQNHEPEPIGAEDDHDDLPF